MMNEGLRSEDKEDVNIEAFGFDGKCDPLLY